MTIYSEAESSHRFLARNRDSHGSEIPVMPMASGRWENPTLDAMSEPGSSIRTNVRINLH